MLKKLFLCALPMVFLALNGCQTVRNVTQRGDLDVVLSKHHVDLRWGRVPHAARYIHPDLQPTFIRDWEERLKNVDINRLEILHIVDDPVEQTAVVTIRFTYIEHNSLTLREIVAEEEWERLDGQWIATKALYPEQKV